VALNAEICNLLTMNRKKVYWILQISGWAIYAFIMLLLLALRDNLTIWNTITFLLNSVLFLVSTHLFRGYIKKHRWVNLPIMALIPRVIFATFILGLFNYFFSILINLTFSTVNFESNFDPFLMITYSFSAMIIYFLWSLLYFIFHFVDKHNKALRYEAAINEFELNKLKSQLNPHFIFNALNSIRALVDEDPKKSKTAITQLSTILRSSLIMNRQKLTKLSDEISTVKDYLELEGIRFEERLKYQLDISPDTRSVPIPPLMVQTLVENGIKHGISNLKEGGFIKVTSYLEDDMLKIQIRNSGKYINGHPQDNKGFGIENTIQRLKLLYGDHSHFCIHNEGDNTVLTELEIPKSV
jgi:two-component system LytT family sensor kinase